MGRGKGHRRQEDYGTRLEISLLKAGFDIHVTVSGDKSQRIDMTYVLMNRPMVYKIMNEMAFPTDTAKKGFQHLTLSDGYHRRWEYEHDIARTSQWVQTVTSD